VLSAPRSWNVVARGLLVVALTGASAAAPARSAAEPAPSALESSDAIFDDSFNEGIGSTVSDPIEPVNRGIFAGNRVVDRVLLDPVTRFYGWLVPGPIKRSVRGVFDNLNQPVVIVNDLLQLQPRRAGSATARFLLNSTFGFAGLFDPASEAGFGPHHSDFGQTLGRAGIGPGIYLVLPLLGPSTTRDAIGVVFDTALRPDTWLLPIAPRLLIGGTWGITEREEHMESLEALESSSVDFYAAVRSAYWMSREALVRGTSLASQVAAPPPEGEVVVGGEEAVAR
jgi:phospholipid-binding lipoprotein MlaA